MSGRSGLRIESTQHEYLRSCDFHELPSGYQLSWFDFDKLNLVGEVNDTSTQRLTEPEDGFISDVLLPTVPVHLAANIPIPAVPVSRSQTPHC